MRVVFLTHYYPPEVGAPQTRISALAEGLVHRGWDVTVHTGFPHYPTGLIQPPYRNRLTQREMGVGGERIVRSAIYATPNRGFARRLLNHASLCASALATSPASGPADVLVVESPPLFLAAAGAAYAAAKRAPLVVNVADRWPASAVELGALDHARVIAAAERLERWIYRRAAAVTVPTRGLQRALSAEAPGRVVRSPPAVDLERFGSVPDVVDASAPLRVLYAGTVGMAHGIETLLAAAQIAGPEIVQVTVAGGGAEASRLAGPLPVNVEGLGIVAADQVPRLYAGADAGVVLLRDRPIFTGALPTKLLEGMAAGRPMIVSARGEAAELVSEANAGLAVPPEDPGALARAFRTLALDPGLRTRLGAAARAAAAGFDRAGSVSDWMALLERVADTQRARR